MLVIIIFVSLYDEMLFHFIFNFTCFLLLYKCSICFLYEKKKKTLETNSTIFYYVFGPIYLTAVGIMMFTQFFFILFSIRPLNVI